MISRRSDRAAARLVGAGVALAVVLVAWVGAGIGAVAAQGASTRAGDLQVFEANGSDPFVEGGSNATFFPQLPEGAECQGDSAHDDFRVQSFILPSSDDPAATLWKNSKPDGEGGRWALYDSGTRNYSQVLTLANDGPGQPGRIDQLPTFSFGVFSPGMIPAGNYRIGFACSYANATTRYWDTRIVITDAADDQPAGFRWAVASPTAESAVSSSSGLARPIVVGLVALVVVAGVVFVLRSRRQPAVHSTKEQP